MPTATIREFSRPRAPFTFGNNAAVYAALHGCTIGEAHARMEGKRVMEEERELERQRRIANGEDQSPPRAPVVRRPAAPEPEKPIEFDLTPIPSWVPIKPESILKWVANAIKVPIYDFRHSISRKRALAWPRGAAVSMIKRLWPELSLNAIAKLFGKDHTTIMHMLRSHNERLADPDYAALWDAMVKVFAAPSTMENDNGAERCAARIEQRATEASPD